MITYPEDSVLHRHIQSALQFTEVSMPDIPQDSVLHRHAIDSGTLSGLLDNKPEIVEKAVPSPSVSVQPADTSYAEPSGGSGFFAWLKKLLSG